MIDELKPLIKKFTAFAKTNLNFKNPPRLFLKRDSENQKCMLGKTAHYDPAEQAVTVFISGRHPKDILRSFSHELVHHCQNERGDLRPEKMKTLNKNYAQENDHMRKMEQQAYLLGNMCFRDWEDGLDDKTQYTMKLAEQKFLKENKNMSVKINKRVLKSLVEKLLKETNKGTRIKDLKDTSTKISELPKTKPDLVVQGETEKEAEKTGQPVAVNTGAQEQEELEEDTCGGKSEDEETAGYRKMEEGEVCEAHKVAGCPDCALEENEESKIQTPEQENTLYEQRFTPKNTRLYEKLLKEWTK